MTQVLRRPLHLLGDTFGSSLHVERMHTDRKDRVLREIEQTLADLVTSDRPPDVGFRFRQRRRFSSSGDRTQQVRGWVYRIERVGWRDSNRTERRYHLLMESGLFVTSTTGSGLISAEDYTYGRKVGPKSFGYVGFSGDHLHFNTASEAEEFVADLRRAFDLPSLHGKFNLQL